MDAPAASSERCAEADVSLEYQITHAVQCEDDSSSLVEVVEFAVTVEAEPETVFITEGEQGPPGASAYADWLQRNPGGTWEQFMSELGSGAIWNTKEW